MFDLNEAIGKWRREMAESDACSSEELDEMESHLHDSVDDLKRIGLGGEEALLVAVHRLGDTRKIAREFVKSNRDGLITRRLVWFCAGILVYLFVNNSAHVVAEACTVVAAPLGLNGYMLGVMAFGLKTVILVATLFLLYRLILHADFSDKISNKLTNYKKRTILVSALAFSFCHWMVIQGGHFLIYPLYINKLSMLQYAESALILRLGHLSWQLLFPILLILIMVRLTEYRKKNNVPLISTE